MIERVKQMLIKEFLQIFRDPKMKAIIFIVPLLQTLIFGYAVTLDVKNIQTAVYDKDQTPASREIADKFFKSGYFVNAGSIKNDKELNDAVAFLDIRAILHILPGFEKAIKRKEAAPFQVIIDGSDANSAGIIASYANKITDHFATDFIKKQQNIDPLLEVETRAWFNTNLESRNYFVPGILTIIVTLLTLTLTSMAIVREKEIGTMEQILVTPITPFEFILGKTIPFVLIAFIDVVIILLVSTYWFEVPIKGPLSALFSGIFLYILTTLGLGLLISTLCTTQQQAMMSAFLFYFPIVLLSGFIFPVANMPAGIKALTVFNPLQHFLVIVRGVFLRGVGFEILWPQMIALAMMGLTILFLATKRFHKTL